MSQRGKARLRDHGLLVRSACCGAPPFSPCAVHTQQHGWTSACQGGSVSSITRALALGLGVVLPLLT